MRCLLSVKHGLWNWAIVICCFNLVGGQTPAELQKPNLLVLIADDHSRADSQPYGSTEVKTPFLKALADEGLRFDRAFVNSPSCAPSRAALLTGMTPPHNGAEPNHSKPRKELAKLPGLLQKLGYQVVAFGKVSHYQHTADYGFDHFAYDSYQDNRGIAAAREWLEKRAGDPAEKRPLALFVGSNWPHVPWPQAEGYGPDNVRIADNQLDTPQYRQARARYLTAVTQMDQELGNGRKFAVSGQPASRPQKKRGGAESFDVC